MSENQQRYLNYGLPEKYLNPNILGVGGMKEIIVCTEKESRRRVALAIPRFDDPQEQKKFMDEARLTARLEHPNIIPVHEVGTTSDGKPYFVMKLASGLTLAKILRKLREQDPEFSEKYPLSVLLDIFLKICNAVEFAHSENVSHLDLKPDNIQIGDFGEVLILDWGLAIEHKLATKEADPEKTQRFIKNEHNTQDGIVKGTPEYMAPEQALGLNSSRGPKCDIYALGAILYAMMTFHAPVSGQNRNEIIQNAAEGKILTPRKQETGGRHIPQVLQFVAFKAMNRAPSKRYASAKALAIDVESYLKGYPTVAENAGFFTKLLLFLKRERLQMFLAISLFFICFIFIVFLMTKIYYKNLELSIYEASALEEQTIPKKINY